MSTPSQTVGPYYAIGLCRRTDNELDPDGIELSGTLYDGQGEPVPDGMIELWDATRRLWGRCGTAEPKGRFRFRVPPDTGVVEVLVFARGMLRHERTRIYLTAQPLPGHRPLTATHNDNTYTFDIHLQGHNATPFFEH